MEQSAVKIFREIYDSEPQVCCFAPGRVNLIGEHTDYNGGHVFPCAIHLGTQCAARCRSDRQLRFYSANFSNQGIVQASLDNLFIDRCWTDYPKSVIRTFRQFGYPLEKGADFVFCGDLPDGAGLSSSAALEVLTGAVLRELFGIPVTAQELAVFGQFAENRFIGVSCGIMDQFASAMGKKDHAILLDTDTLDCEYALLPGSEVSVVIVNSGVKHSLASSAYNDRRRECETALAALRREMDAPSLCSLTAESFEKYCHVISDEIVRKRAKHAIYENIRTLEAVRALCNNDLSAFGQLMNESHRSLRDDYEVSCEELNFLAETAWKTQGVYGARMTGGGFGGCTVNLVKNEYTENFVHTIKQAYRNAVGRETQVYTVGISDGAGRIEDAETCS